jgi:hypothetical protein
MSKIIAPASFSWSKIISDCGLSGFDIMLASQCVPVYYDASIPKLHLEIHVALKVYSEKKGINSLLANLVKIFGDDLVLETTFGDAIGSPALIAQENKISKYHQALVSISEDGFTTRMNKEFGAKVVIQSIKDTY